MTDIIILPNPPELPDSSPLSSVELGINRRNTKVFIDADPIILELVPYGKEETLDGGFKLTEGDPRDPQTFRLIPQSDVMPQVQGLDGIILTPTYVLLGEHDCAMERWDRFMVGDIHFMIVSSIRPDYSITNVYERKGDVARF